MYQFCLTNLSQPWYYISWMRTSGSLLEHILLCFYLNVKACFRLYSSSAAFLAALITIKILDRWALPCGHKGSSEHQKFTANTFQPQTHPERGRRFLAFFNSRFERNLHNYIASLFVYTLVFSSQCESMLLLIV